MTEGDLCGLVREHLYGPRDCPEGWTMGRDISIIRSILKRRPAETRETVAHAIMGIGQMRSEHWFKRTEQITMKIFYGRTKLGIPYFSVAKGRYYRAETTGRRAPASLKSVFAQIATRGDR